MPLPRKYSDEFRMECFDLYCGGMSPSKIAQKMGVTGKTIQRLKAAKWPDNWDKCRAQRVAKQVELIQETALESIEKIRARHSKKLQSAIDLAIHLLARKARDGTLNEITAQQVLFKAMAEEQKLHLPLEDVHVTKDSKFGGAVGAFAKPTGEVGVLMTLNKMFEEAHGPRNSGQDIEPTGQSGQPSGPGDPKDV